MKRISGPLGIVLAVIGGVAILAAVVFIKRNETRLLQEARRDMTREAAHAPG